VNQIDEFKEVPADYLTEPEEIPEFWISSVEEVYRFLDERIKKGKVETIGTSAGGREMRAVFYGESRAGKGTTTFSGALGFRDVRAYFGPDYEKKVYLGLGAVHGGEFEGIVGYVNLLSVLETGRDLRGREWPEILQAAAELDRIILLPITNPDGRARIPLRMESFRGEDGTVYEYLNTGGLAEGKIIGWPECKEHVPLDFSTVAFPGGYPNDAGVNIQHDDFMGELQPETRALFALTARERPDLMLSMHTGAPGNNYFARMHRPFLDPLLVPAFEGLYRKVHAGLTEAGLQSSRNASLEADPEQARPGPYNLNGALSLHCGVLGVTIESPCHGFSARDREGNEVVQTPEMIVDAQLTCHLEGMRYLAETGGRCRWTPGRERSDD